MVSGIYSIVNRANGKRYVGSAKDLRARERSHWNALARGTHGSPKLQHSYNKHGRNVFTFEVLETIARPTKNKMQAREQHWMDVFQSYTTKCGYNIQPKAYSNLGVRYGKRSEKTCAAVRAGIKRFYKNGGEPWNKGRPWSEKTKEKISEKIRLSYANGRKHPRPNLGKRLPAKWRSNISKGHKRYHQNGGRIWNVGKKGAYQHSHEAKKKMSAAMKRWWASAGSRTRRRMSRGLRNWSSSSKDGRSRSEIIKQWWTGMDAATKQHVTRGLKQNRKYRQSLEGERRD